MTRSSNRSASSALSRLAVVRSPGEPQQASAGLDDRLRPSLPPATGPSMLAGRQRELELLDHAFAAGRRGGRVAWISGPTGSGKSRLLAEVKHRQRQQGAMVLEGRCRDHGRAYSPFIDILQAAQLELAESGVNEELLSDVAALLDLLSGRAVAPAPDPQRWEDLRSRFFERVRAVLLAASRVRPLLLLIDDLDTACQATRALATYLGRSLCNPPELCFSSGDFRGLLVFTARVGVDREQLDSQVVVEIPLAGLDLEGLRAWLAGGEFAERLHAASAGQPRVVEELLDQAIAGAAGRPSAGERLRARLDSLPSLSLRTLSACAVFARPLSVDALARVVHLGSDPAATLAPLLAGRLLRKAVRGGAIRLLLASEDDRQAVLEQLSAEELRRLHHRIGELLLEGADQADLPECAEHLLAAGAERAVEVALEAGRRLEASFAHDRALELYRRAAALVPAGAVQLRIVERLCELCAAVGDYPRALEHARQLERLAPLDLAARLRTVALQIRCDDPAAARATLSSALQLARRADGGGGGDSAGAARSTVGPASIDVARLLAQTAEVCYLGGDHLAARQAAEQSLVSLGSAAGAAGPEHVAVRLGVCNTLAKILLAEGRYAEAAEELGASLETARALGRGEDQLRALINLGIAHLRRGHSDLAEACYRDGLAVGAACQDHLLTAFCLQNLGALLHLRCQYAEALRYFQQAVAAFKRLGQKARLAWVAVDLGTLYLDLGDLDRAAAMETMASRLGSGELRVAAVINLEMLRGRLAAQRGEGGRARSHLQRAATLARQHDNRERLAEALLLAADLELVDGEPEAARRCLERLDAPPSARAAARALLLRALLAVEDDCPEVAERLLAEAAERCAELDDLEGRLRAELASHRMASSMGDHGRRRRAALRARAVQSELWAAVPKELRAGYQALAPLRELHFILEQEQHLQVGLQAGRRSPGATAGGAVAATTTMPTAAIAGGATLGATAGDSIAAPIGRAARYPQMVGRHPCMEQLFALLDKLAGCDSMVLIRGESGTGKELVAEAIHRHSTRRQRPLVKVNCGALVETLLLSELFGHERGAFTGAVARHRGRFEIADGGTLFLDEIGDISPRTQVALLRVLQECEIQRVGSTTPIRVDVRVICATHRNLEAMVQSGEFREDLYYRLKGIEVEVPPLRERIDDLGLLAGTFLNRLAVERGATPRTLSEAALALLRSHDWPGNVRELENVIRSVSLLCEGPVIDVQDFSDYAEVFRQAAGPQAGGVPPLARQAFERVASGATSLRALKREIEVECIRRALERCDGNITRAADLLGMKRPRLSQVIKELGIPLPAATGEAP